MTYYSGAYTFLANVDGRPNRTNKAVFPNFTSVAVADGASAETLHLKKIGDETCRNSIVYTAKSNE